jgi:transposase
MWGGDTFFSRLGYRISLVSSALSEQEVATAIAQRIIVKFLTNEGVKPSEILTRLHAQFGDMMSSSALSEQEVATAIAQRIIVKFLTNKGVKPSEILTRLHAQFGDMTSSTQVYDWASKFKGGREAVENESHNRRPRTSLTDDNIRAICDLIEGDRRLTVDEIAYEVSMSWKCTLHYHGAPWVQ